jgi:hypothetical protein
VIEGCFGVRYHPAYVEKILHACGWDCQKSQRWGKERDEEQIQAWRNSLSSLPLPLPRIDIGLDFTGAFNEKTSVPMTWLPFPKQQG